MLQGMNKREGKFGFRQILTVSFRSGILYFVRVSYARGRIPNALSRHIPHQTSDSYSRLESGNISRVGLQGT